MTEKYTKDNAIDNLASIMLTHRHFDFNPVIALIVSQATLIETLEAEKANMEQYYACISNDRTELVEALGETNEAYLTGLFGPSELYQDNKALIDRIEKAV